jgi:DNA polymerase elongation subunit (family B)
MVTAKFRAVFFDHITLRNYAMKFPYYFVFDIETVGFPIDHFDDAQQEYLLRGAQTDEDRAKKIREFSLAALTAKVVCIGIVVMEWQPDGAEAKCVRQGALILDESLEPGRKKRIELAGGIVGSASDESTMLSAFWKMLAEYFDNACLVSFNGKDFDAPFLMLRSAACRVRPSKKIVDMNKSWDKVQKHIDLLKELTFNSYGANMSGAARRYNFDFYARAFGIASPKAEGVHGGNVAEFYAEGRTKEIAEYCMRDVHATWELYRYWREYLDFSE